MIYIVHISGKEKYFKSIRSLEKALLLLICFLAFNSNLRSQGVYKITADSVDITNSCDSAELILQNHTQGVSGFLFNSGNGLTKFKGLFQKLNDTTYLFGPDTLKIFSASEGRNLFQPLENQRLSTSNSPNFSGLTVNGHTVWNAGNLQVPIAGTFSGPTSPVTFSSLINQSGLETLYDTTRSELPGTTDSAWWNVINVRHRNGVGDGNNYGMQIASELTTSLHNLYFRNQSLGTWTSWKKIWHSGNATAGTGISISGATVTNSGDLSLNTRTGAVSLSSSDVTGALGYTPPTHDRYYKFVNTINTNSATTTSLFTSSSTDSFVVTSVAIVTSVVPSSGATTFTFSMGTNSSSFNNIVPSTIVSISTANIVNMIRPTGYVIILPSTSFSIKITTASGPGATVKSYVTGYYMGGI